MNILVTGGMGYIGSHVCVALANSGYNVIVLDNLSNSHSSVAEKINLITGNRISLVVGDIRDKSLLITILREKNISAVFHFAGLKSIEESTRQPLEYYSNNVVGSMILCNAMLEVGIKTLVFSSSATIYGNSDKSPITESSPVKDPNNPYGRTKLIIEQFLADLVLADDEWRIARLRYFNPIGAHETGLIGENSDKPSANLMPSLVQVATGRLSNLNVYGNDYETRDGTGIRDYIHVLDLANGHVKALDYLRNTPGLLTLNLGTGCGVSVLELIKAFEVESGRKISFQFASRRVGDVAECWADPSLAEKLIGWKAQYDLAKMCRDVWRWEISQLELDNET